ncbi:MAG: hypothetical protein OSB00_04310 [Sphingomonas bacterium]|nr:hypothetical protein [Sphingomonas bacterium]
MSELDGNRRSTVERAFELARSGSCPGISDVRRALKEERFDRIDEHFSGPTFRKEIVALCRASRAPTQ